MRFKSVPKQWRQVVEPRTRYRNRNRRETSSPIAQQMLEGKTLLVWEVANRKREFASLYRLAQSNDKILHIHEHADIDSDIYDGYLMWMD